MNCPHHGEGDAVDTMWCGDCHAEVLPGQARRDAILVKLAECEHPSPIQPAGTRLLWCRPCGAIRSADGEGWTPSKCAREAQELGPNLRGAR